jgi:hypothetical protein
MATMNYTNAKSNESKSVSTGTRDDQNNMLFFNTLQPTLKVIPTPTCAEGQKVDKNFHLSGIVMG